MIIFMLRLNKLISPSSITTTRRLVDRFKLLRTLFIQTEDTPNDDALKFYPGRSVLENPSENVSVKEGGPSPPISTLEFINAREALASPLAKRLFQVDGVQHVFLGPDFITVTKDSSFNWPILKPDIYSAITEFYSSGEPIVLSELEVPSDTTILETDSEPVQMIKELIETRIRPVIQRDGGDLQYIDFVDGIVKLRLRGACRTCSSSVTTLRNGIENMLMHYVPEVMGVEEYEEPSEQVGLQEFEKLEARIKQEQNLQSSTQN